MKNQVIPDCKSLSLLLFSINLQFFAVGCNSYQGPSGSSSQYNTAQKMAVLDGVANYTDLNNTAMIRYQYLLKELSSKYNTTEAQVGEITFKSKKMLHDKYGKDITMLELMEGVNKASVVPGYGSYAENISLFVTLLSN